MQSVPKLLSSSVIRGAQLGESHGGLYLVDFAAGRADLKLDWNRTDIDLEGRGGDRGLRGIAFHDERVLVAANAEILMLDQDFRCVESFTNRYLRHCHEISRYGSLLFVTSTGYDSVLVLDLRRRRFTHGFHLGVANDALKLTVYDTQSDQGPEPSRRFHINSVQATPEGFRFSGLYTPGLLHTDGRKLSLVAPLPRGTHNAQLLNDGALLYNDTAADRVCYSRSGETMSMDVPRYPRDRIVNIERFASEVARPGFARGLCPASPDIIAAGSSPSTISLYDLGQGTRVATQTLSLDVRNAIHGLAVWPY